MGLLELRTQAYNWEESKYYQDYIKQYGIKQAIQLWNKFKSVNKKSDELKWGDEVEYQVATIDLNEQKAYIHAEGFEKVMEALENKDQEEFIYQAEFASWMVEAVPLEPYNLYDVNAPKVALGSLIKRRK